MSNALTVRAAGAAVGAGRLGAGAGFEATTQLREDGPGTRFAWGRAKDARAIGGSYRWERRRDASVTFGFEGGAVTLFTVAGPAMGNAALPQLFPDGATISIRWAHADGSGAGRKA